MAGNNIFLTPREQKRILNVYLTKNHSLGVVLRPYFKS